MSKESVDEVLAQMPIRNLRGKLALLRELVPNIEKKGHNQKQNYDFMRAEDLAGDIGDKMCLMGVSMVPARVQVVAHDIIEVKRSDGSSRTDFHVILIVTYRFVDVDSDEHIDVEATGEGVDQGDKATNKAMTGAKKYALSQALTLRIGEDSEADERTDEGIYQPAAKTAPAPAPAVVPGTTVPHMAGGSAISQKQRTRMFAIAKGNVELIKAVQKKWGYASSNDISWKDYDAICKEIERLTLNPDAAVPNADEADIQW